MALEKETRWRIKIHRFEDFIEHRCEVCMEAKGGLLLLQDSDTCTTVLVCSLCVFDWAKARRKEVP